jgi:BrxA
VPSATYRLSFTTGGLLRAQAVAIAEIVVSVGDISAARDIAVRRNLVQQRTAASTERVTREVVQRLAALPASGVDLVARGSGDDTRHIMWLAACLRYRFLRDFGREVIRDRYTSGRSVLDLDDFDTFWNLQSSWIDALRDAAASTRGKLRQNTFRMIREAGLLSDDHHVLPVLLSPSAVAVIVEASAELLLSFPIDDAQIAALKTRRSGAL